MDELLLLAVRPNGALTYNDIAKDELELTRFRGHPNVSYGGVRDGVQEYPVHTGV